MVNQHKNRKIKMVVHMESDEKKKKQMLELEPQHAITAGRHIGLSACHRCGTPSKSQY